ncbi:MAG TPA: hypothetical protein VFR62_03330 [Gemmatimonadales bacterium]|nr:hypothetical protein [Gemmatimonadales bacterium]
MITAIFDTTSAELASLADRGADDVMNPIEEEAIVSFLEIRASKAELQELRGKLHAIIQSLTAVGPGGSAGAEDADHARYRLTLAYFPLDGAEHGPRIGG